MCRGLKKVGFKCQDHFLFRGPVHFQRQSVKQSQDSKIVVVRKTLSPVWFSRFLVKVSGLVGPQRRVLCRSPCCRLPHNLSALPAECSTSQLRFRQRTPPTCVYAHVITLKGILHAIREPHWRRRAESTSPSRRLSPILDVLPVRPSTLTSCW